MPVRKPNLASLAEAYECLNTAIFILTEKNYKILFANRMASKMTGRRKPALEKMKFVEIFETADSARVSDILEAGGDFGLFSGYALKVERKSRRIVSADIFGKQLKIGQEKLIVFTVHDITALQAANETLEERVERRTLDLRRANQALQGEMEERKRVELLVNETRLKLFVTAKLAALGEMASGVAHEINNPLTVVQGCVESILSSPERAAEFATKIQGSVDRAVRVVKGLQTFAREGTDDPMKRTFVGSLLEDSVLLYRQRMKEHGIDLRVDVGPPDLAILCRGTQLSQVLVNLISNAHDAVAQLPEKWVAVRVEDRGKKVVFSVTDSGPRISPQVQERIFEPFFTTKGPAKGIGLGLSISRGIVEGHGGRIEIDSKSQNTRFVVEIPKEVRSSK